MGKAVKRLFFLGVVAGIGYAVWRAVRARMPAPSDDLAWETAPFPFPPVPRPPRAVAPLENEPANEPAQDADAAPAATGAWVEADDGGCPATHPVKGKLSSGIFHVPGGQNYERTRADRCYVDPEAAAADGLRQSQR